MSPPFPSGLLHQDSPHCSLIVEKWEADFLIHSFFLEVILTVTGIYIFNQHMPDSMKVSLGIVQLRPGKAIVWWLLIDKQIMIAVSSVNANTQCPKLSKQPWLNIKGINYAE